jgi:hypothetical protein
MPFKGKTDKLETFMLEEAIINHCTTYLYLKGK